MTANTALILREIAHRIDHGGRQELLFAPLSCQFDPGQLHMVSGTSDPVLALLLSILGLTTRPTRGQILWQGADLLTLPPALQSRWRRQHLAMVLQPSRLIGIMTVREQVRLAANLRGGGAAERAALAALEALGMTDMLGRLPADLSPAQQQGVALAEAIGVRPAILLAQDPVAGLDPVAAQRTMGILRGFASDHSAIVICTGAAQGSMHAADRMLTLEAP